jgi:hypothetical protein
MSTFEFRGREVDDPRVVIETIVSKCPQGGSEKWLRVFAAVAAERPALRQMIIAQVFTATLLSLSATDAPPSR